VIFGMTTLIFVHVPALNTLAPTQAEPPILVTQVIVLALFVVFAIVAAIRFRAGPLRAT
jgi:hypothetical protein